MAARTPKALVVGGSIAGLSCAHALLSAGWHVSVVEKSAGPPTSGSPTGAGLGLDPQSLQLLSSWVGDLGVILDATVPLSVDLNRTTDSEKKTSRVLSRDGKLNFKAAHWTDLHSLLRRHLPEGVIHWGHQFLSFEVSGDESRPLVIAKARVIQSDELVEITGDLLVAADGSLSGIRQRFLPDFRLRYSGYYAWRGVLDFSEQENSDTMFGIRKAYPELGDCLYFDLAHRTHSVLYELKDKRLNWLWYMNGAEPEQKGSSVTAKVSDDMIEKLHQEADRTWLPELAKVIKETKEPFINTIYDSDPLPQLVWDNVVLVGDAAHPTTPHGLRSTNMSIQDAGILGHCIEKWGPEKLTEALEEFQKIRRPVVSEQVLYARKLGRLKQGLDLNGEIFDPRTASTEACLVLQQRSMPHFFGVPFPC